MPLAIIPHDPKPSQLSRMSGLTQRAPDPRQSTPGPWWWESARFQAVGVAWSLFRYNGVVSSHPPAGNAHRWVAKENIEKGSGGMNIRLADSDDDWDQIKGLFRDYFQWISQDQGIDLAFQGIEDELESLPGAFSPPAGCVLLAEMDDQIAGCVALRPLDAQICEMKRMYVKPEYRAKGVGRALGEQIIRDAKNRGYRLMRLDTANTMKAAQGLYSSLGFKPTQQYYDLPPDILERAIFMELSIQ